MNKLIYMFEFLPGERGCVMKEVSVIIPAFDEQETILDVATDMLTILKEGGWNFEIFIVDDGSADETGKIARALEKEHPEITVIRHQFNKGLGAAVMAGVDRSSRKNAVLVPADGQFDPEEIEKYIDALEKNDMVIGIRTDLGGYTTWRKVQSLLYVKAVSILFNQHYSDVNWVQAWRRDVFKVITPSSQGVFFLQEVIARARMAGLKIGRVPSVQLARGGGEAEGGRFATIVLTIWEMLLFWWEEFRKYRQSLEL